MPEPTPAPASSQSLPARIYNLLVIGGTYAQPAVLLGILLLWGSAFLLAGLGKLRNLDRTAENFAGLDIPAPYAQAVLVASVEFFGGLMFVLGLGTRFAAVALIGAMIGAIHFASDISLFTAVSEETAVLFKDPSAAIKVTPVSYLAVSFVLFAFGAGAASLDAVIKKMCCRGEPNK